MLRCHAETHQMTDAQLVDSTLNHPPLTGVSLSQLLFSRRFVKVWVYGNVPLKTQTLHFVPGTTLVLFLTVLLSGVILKTETNVERSSLTQISCHIILRLTRYRFQIVNRTLLNCSN